MQGFITRDNIVQDGDGRMTAESDFSLGREIA
jgi:hypothetical protein